MAAAWCCASPLPVPVSRRGVPQRTFSERLLAVAPYAQTTIRLTATHWVLRVPPPRRHQKDFREQSTPPCGTLKP